MRKCYLLLLITASMTLARRADAQAVKRQHEYAVHVGAGSLYNLLQNALSTERYYSSGIYGGSVRYYLGRTITVGGNVSLEYMWEPVVARRELAVTVAPEVTISYWDRKVTGKQVGIRLYGLAAVGITAYRDLVYKDTKAFPNVQFSLFGARIGNNLAGFAEMGLGYRGLINVGLAYRPPIQKKVVKQ